MQPDLDTWWAEQASRRPCRFQLWRAPRRTPTVLVATSDDRIAIASEARRLREPCVVVDTRDGTWPLSIRSDRVEVGSWAVERPGLVAQRIAAAEAMRGLRDGELVRRRLGLHAQAAKRAAGDLMLGHVIVRGVWHPLPGGRDKGLLLEVSGAGLVVRRPR